MHKISSFALAIGLVASPMAWADPLTPGKPAGVHQAQMTTESWIVAGGLGAASMALIAVAASGDDKAAAQPTTASTATTS